MKKAILVLALAAVFAMAFTGTAFANFGPHGGYALDTDACAGCHRAHTSFSSVTWKDQANNDHTALLVSSASTMQQFCYACHGDGAPGASTNVQSGVFDSGPSTAGHAAPAGAQMYVTNSSFNATLNAGGFDRVPSGAGFSATTSMHDMERGSATDPMWGAGASAPTGTNFTCTDCHDPHGSTNYRLLKDRVNGVTVGGYVGDVPQPYVFSSEEGYPVGGWLKHNPGAVQMAAYYPNYTTAEYAFALPDPGYSAGSNRSISTWCSACHAEYDNRTSAYDYLGYEAVDATRNASGALVPGAGASIGSRVRHRHPVNITLAAGVGPTRALAVEVVTSTVLPLEAKPGVTHARGTWDTDDYLGCLTCHRAHGTSAVMTGWATAKLETNASAVVTWYPVKTSQAWNSGVNPNFSSALLRADNRGVCERCHNK